MDIPRTRPISIGFGSLDISIDDLTKPNQVIQLGNEPNRIDVMTSISGVGFDEAWEAREAGPIDGITVNFIGRAALLRNQAARGRNKDRNDLEELLKQDP